MRTKVLWLVAAICLSSGSPAPAQTWQLLDTVSGENLLIIEAAMPEFTRRDLDLRYFTVYVSREGDKVIVSFHGNGMPDDLYGQTKYIDGLEVHLHTDDLSLIGSWFPE